MLFWWDIDVIYYSFKEESRKVVIFSGKKRFISLIVGGGSLLNWGKLMLRIDAR